MLRAFNIIIIIIAAVTLLACGSMGKQAGSDSNSEPILIKKLSDITQAEYNAYKKYVKNSEAYVIVHPYYTLFSKPSKKLRRKLRKQPEVREFVDRQVKIENEFIESSVKEGSLVILVLPGDRYSNRYKAHLNNITQGARSVIYMHTKRKESGNIDDDQLDTLGKFMDAIGVRSVIVGGGYIGRCQEMAYKDLSTIFGDENIAISPEISSFSPSDITAATVKMFMQPDNQMNFKVISSYIKTMDNVSADKPANIRNLNLRNN
ncbi:MAG: hypothetical protein JSV21_08050 [Nitrospirota bacterium]|nr:MAG: hypothetical protein JSV21_08050 [Nitrospirota bacterium]